MIRLNNISYKAGNFHLKKINLEIPESKFHVLLGPTGSGKTLLLELITGLNKQSSGSINLSGKDAGKKPPEQRNISYLPQDATLFPHWDVFRNISYGLKLQKKPEDIIKQKVKSIANDLNIYHLLSREIHKLSGGEKQRIALARALVLDNPVLLLDEPTSALHETMQEEFCLLLKRIHKKYRLTVLMSTHQKNSAFLLADQLHFIHSGEILLSATPSEIETKSLPFEVAQLLGISNMIHLKLNNIFDDEMEYTSQQLNTLIYLSRQFEQEMKEFIIGLKPDDIRVIKDEDDHPEIRNAFECEIESVLFKEKDALVGLRVRKTRFTLKMQLPIYNYKRMKLADGKIIRCKIKEDYMRKIFRK